MSSTNGETRNETKNGVHPKKLSPPLSPPSRALTPAEKTELARLNERIAQAARDNGSADYAFAMAEAQRNETRKAMNDLQQAYRRLVDQFAVAHEIDLKGAAKWDFDGETFTSRG